MEPSFIYLVNFVRSSNPWIYYLIYNDDDSFSLINYRFLFFLFFWWMYSVFAWDCLYCEFVHEFYGFNLQIQCRFLHLTVLFYFILLQMILIFCNMQLLANMFMYEKDKTNLENKLWRSLNTSYMKLDENNDSVRSGYWTNFIGYCIVKFLKIRSKSCSFFYFNDLFSILLSK